MKNNLTANTKEDASSMTQRSLNDTAINASTSKGNASSSLTANNNNVTTLNASAAAAMMGTSMNNNTSNNPTKQYYNSIGRSKEPAVLAAEKLMLLMTQYEGLEEVMNALDPSITFVSPMVYYRGRPVVKSWIQFEAKTLIPFQPFIKIKDIKSEDEMKSATIRWSVGGLHFTDRIHLSQLLQYQIIHRALVRQYKTLDDKLIAEEVLRLLTGPHFSGHCQPRQGCIDNSALVLPTLDFSHLNLRDYKQLLTADASAASTARPIVDMNVVYHFMSDALVKAQIESEKRKEAEEEKSRKTNFSKSSGEKMVIKATNRDGEKKMLVIDKADFFRSSQHTTVEQLQDDEVTGIATKHDRPRFLCSCIRLRNNFFGAREDEQFDADGKLIDPATEEAAATGSAAAKANAVAAAAARLAKKDAKGVHVNNGHGADSAMGYGSNAAELATILKLITINSFYFVTNVDLSSNKLTLIPDLSELPLVGLSLHDNRLASWEDLELKLKPLKLLQNLTLFANPIQKEAAGIKEYKYGILSLFLVPQSQALKDPPPGPLSGGGGGSSTLYAQGRNSAASYSGNRAPKTLNISASYEQEQRAIQQQNTTAQQQGQKGNATTLPSSNGRSLLPPLLTSVAATGAANTSNAAHHVSFQQNNDSAVTNNIGSKSHQNTFSNNNSSGAARTPHRGGSAGASSAYVIALRSLDHCVVSPKEADIVKAFLKTFQAKRELHIKEERKQLSSSSAKGNGAADGGGGGGGDTLAVGSGKGAAAALRKR